MTYLEAEMMEQEMIAALRFRETLPDEYKNVAKKYSAEQWMEFRKAMFEELERRKDAVTGMVKFAMLVRKGVEL